MRAADSARIATVLVALAGCASNADAPSAGCVTGRVVSCACPEGRTGTQRCGADHRYEPCVCPTSDDAAAEPPPVDAAQADGAAATPDVRMVPSCPAGTPCDEDGDGVDGPQCRGTDCDDRDCLRYPSRAEVCDRDDRDEDCDPCTVAAPRDDGDRDNDTFVSVACRNRIPAGAQPVCPPTRVRVDLAGGWVMGRDCADEDNNRRPDQVEVCNGLDDNCDGRVDEDFRGGLCGTGLPGACADGVNECRGGRLTCVPAVMPGARPETCNGLDDDCDGFTDESTPRVGEPCRPPGVDEPSPSPCRLGRIACVLGRERCEGGARPETCNGLDDDCDGRIDEEPEATAACRAPNGLARCRDGACRIETCDAGLADCDADARNGCEADLRSSREHCGRCGEPCAGTCTDGWCSAGPRAIAAGFHQSCALRGGGSIVCWGFNSAGALGDGTVAPYAIAARPVRPQGLTNAAEAYAFLTVTIRLASGRAAQLGWASVPVDVGADDLVAVGAECGARRDGTILDWQSRALRTVAPPLPGVTALVGNCTCALVGSGALRCRTGADGMASWVAVPLAGAVTSACAGGGFRCATTADGAAWCWGSNQFGQLGDGTTLDSVTPVAVRGVARALSVACTAFHACVVTSDGAVWCWGNNESGQLGVGDRGARTLPGPVVGLRDAVAVACGDGHSCARVRDGRVYCWGANQYGEAGGGASTPRITPAAVPIF